MFFKPEAVPAELPRMVQQCIAITGWPAWKARLRSLEQWVEDNPLFEDYLAEKYPLEIEMGRTRRHIRLGQTIGLPGTYEQVALYSFLFMVTRAHQRLGPAGQRRLAGMLRDCLKAESGLAPLQHEMVVAAHMMGRGFDVTFHDMEAGSGFDILATQDGLEIEVEAKTLSGDVGRKVHKRRLYQLARHVLRAMDCEGHLRAGGQIARIKLPARLSGADEQIREISSRLARVLASGVSEPGPEPCAVEYTTFPLEGSPFQRSHPEALDRDAIEKFVNQLLGVENVSMLFLETPDRNAVVVTVESLQSDAVLDAMVRALKGAANRQLTGVRQGIICVRLTDPKEGKLAAIAGQDRSGQPSALQVASNRLLDPEDWPHVLKVIYLTRGAPTSSQSTRGDILTQSVRETGPAYSFTNRDHELAGDERVAIF